MSDLRKELKESIIDQLNLEELGVNDIANDDPLFGDGLGLDSIDALELIVLLEKDYGIKLEEPEQGKKIFVSIDKMAEYIEVHRTK
ncbi:phosphopantetheine-binding protein [soil metagenome]